MTVERLMNKIEHVEQIAEQLSMGDMVDKTVLAKELRDYALILRHTSVWTPLDEG